nr:hypothetical protein BaRGS_008164 [Batillaria attramentaria]
MVADSTQSDTENKKKKHKPAGRKEKKTKKDRRRRRRSSSSGSRSSSSSDNRRSRSRGHGGGGGGGGGSGDGSDDEYDSDVDLKKELKPLSAYLRQPPVLLDQMLHSVRGSSLQRALPDVLKTMPLEELKRRCLEHLEVMSRKRIRRILAGDDPAAISSSGTDDDDSSDDDKQKDEGIQTGEGVGSTSDAEKISHDADTGSKMDDAPVDSPLSLGGDDMDHELDTDQRHLQEEGELSHEEGEASPEEEMGEECEVEDAEEEEGEAWGVEGGGETDVADVLFPEVEQDKMELLELEMRARAIKAMLAIHEQREKGAKK